MANFNNAYTENFYKAVLSLETVEECRAFFDDICTIKELQEISRRLEVARLLSEGKVFSEINRLSEASSATISRVNKCLMYGSGGEIKALATLEEKEGGVGGGRMIKYSEKRKKTNTDSARHTSSTAINGLI